jgi:hypothetical protein
MTPNRHLSHVHGVTFPEPEQAKEPTRGERIADLIWAQLEDRPLGLVRAPEERKRDLAAAIDALAAGKVAPPAPPSDPGALDAAYRDMAQAAGEQIRAAARLALKQNDGARDLNMWRAGLDRANGLVAAAFSRLHAALASAAGKAPAAERGEK